MTVPLLKIEELKLFLLHQQKWVNPLRSVNLEIAPKEIVGLVGESGSGKSLTAKAILKLFPQGFAKIEAQRLSFSNINSLTAGRKLLQKVRGKQIGLILQDSQSCLDPTMKVGEQIEEALLTHEIVSSKDAAVKEAKRLLELVQIANVERVYYQYPFELSGGMRQRVVIAAVIAPRPQLIIADEPTTALDLETQSSLMKLLKTIQKELATSILLITHDLFLAKAFCEQIVVMYGGETIEVLPKSAFEKPFHPYTDLLMHAKPTLSTLRSKPLPTIPGSSQSLPPGLGCVFCNRCPKAMRICQNKTPAKHLLQDDHSVRCFLVDKKRQKEEVLEYAASPD